MSENNGLHLGEATEVNDISSFLEGLSDSIGINLSPNQRANALKYIASNHSSGGLSSSLQDEVDRINTYLFM